MKALVSRLASAGLVALLSGCGGASEPAEPAVNGPPEITALSPDTAVMGNPDATLVIRGRNFHPLATVSVEAVVVANVTWFRRSPTEITLVILDAAMLREGRPLAVRVHNPGGPANTSAPAMLTMKLPRPVIRSLTPSTISAGDEHVTVQIKGTGFFPFSTEVEINGKTHLKNFVRDTQIDVPLTLDDVKQPGTLSFVVGNAAEPSRTSAPMSLTVSGGLPSLTRLPSMGATAGRAGFELAVDGLRLDATSVVTWNGSDRPTTYISGRRLTATISAADVASPNVAQVGVRNASGNAPTRLSFTTRPLGSLTPTSRLEVSVPAEDVVYDSRTDRLYATVRTGAYANSVVAIDARTGRVTGAVAVGPLPSRIVMSDDGVNAYVLLNEGRYIRRVQVSPLEAQLQFTPAPSPGSGAAAALVGDLQVVPGNNRAVAIVRSGDDVAIYDDDRIRPRATAKLLTYIDLLAFGDDASTLFGYGTHTIGAYRLGVDALGATVLSSAFVTLFFYDGSIAYNNGRVYSSNGIIFDPERLVQIAKLPFFAPVVADPTLGRLFVASSDIIAFDMNTGLQLGVVRVDAAEHTASVPRRPVRWGTDGIAYTDGKKLYIVRVGVAAAQ